MLFCIAFQRKPDTAHREELQSNPKGRKAFAWGSRGLPWDRSFEISVPSKLQAVFKEGCLQKGKVWNSWEWANRLFQILSSLFISLCLLLVQKIQETDVTWFQDSTATATSLQFCPTLCDPIDSSPPGSPVPGILQARTLEWVAISFSNAYKWKVKVKSLSRVRLLATPWTAAYQALQPMGFSRQEYWSGVPLSSPRLKVGSNSK